MERSEYPAMLPQLQPGQAVNILNDRVQQVGRLNTAIADWLQERRRLEEQYATGMRKLAQKPLEGLDLGVFSVPWTTLTGQSDAIAGSHSALAAKIEADVERPLRDFASSNREMSQMSTIQGNLQAMAREVEKAQQKTEKLRGKGEKTDSGKVANASSELETAQSQWDTQAPYVFENLQALDEARLNHLRDVLTQLQTHEVDQIERTRGTAEQCLNVLLNVETTDEIKTFALKAVRGGAMQSRGLRSSLSYPTQTRAGSSATQLAASPAPYTPDSSLNREVTPSMQDEKQKGRLGGLKRLSTVMGRKKNSKTSSNLPPTSESPERRPSKPPAFNSFGQRTNRSRDQAPTSQTFQEDFLPRQRPAQPMQLGSELFDAPSEIRTDPVTPTRNIEAPSGPPQSNGTSLAILNGGHADDLADLEPPRPVERDIQTPPVTEAQKDAEGFSVPPEDLDPISQAEKEAGLAREVSPLYNVNILNAPVSEGAASSEAAFATVANKLQAPPPTTRRAGTVRGRRTDRNSFLPPEQPIAESTSNASPSQTREAIGPATADTAVPAGISSTSATASAFAPSPPTGFAPGQLAASTFSPFSPQAEQQTSFFPSDSRAATSPDRARADDQSIRSATTSTSQAGSKHPELTEKGLNSSVVETINARFDNGKLTTSSLTGEIALTYNPADFSTPFGTESIRLENFSSLEKVAPNPVFISQTPDKEGEYSVNLSSLGRTQVAFKYQVRVNDSAQTAPLLITPAYKIEPNQLSVILSYSLDPTFALQGQESITFSNVMLALAVEGTKATSCQSRPVGTFSAERNLIFWQLGEITLAPGAPPQKLLARFATESEAQGGSAEVRWEVSSSSLDSGRGISVLSQRSGAGDGSDPFADEGAAAHAGTWVPVPGARKMVSGSYVAK